VLHVNVQSGIREYRLQKITKKTCRDSSRVHRNINQVRYYYTILFSEWLNCCDVGLFICICGQDHHLPPPLLPNIVWNSITGCSYLSRRVSPTLVVPEKRNPFHHITLSTLRQEGDNKQILSGSTQEDGGVSCCHAQPTHVPAVPVRHLGWPARPPRNTNKVWLNAIWRETLVKTEHKQQIFHENHNQKLRKHAAFCVGTGWASRSPTPTNV
jgi:hypothetical protein